MSATLDAARVAALIADDRGPAPIVEAPGRRFPVQIRYRPSAKLEQLPQAVAEFLRNQAEPQYLEEVTAAPDEDEGDGLFAGEGGGSGDDLYDQAVAVVTRDRKASTSYVQRRLQIGYNRAASLIERMEKEGVVSAANHAGKRDILAGPPPPV